MKIAKKYFKNAISHSFDQNHLIIECQKKDKTLGELHFCYIFKLPEGFIKFSGDKMGYVANMGYPFYLNMFDFGFNFMCYEQEDGTLYKGVIGYNTNTEALRIESKGFYLEQHTLSRAFDNIDFDRVREGDEIFGYKRMKVIEVVDLRQ